MRETFVQYETAELAERKGFIADTMAFYWKDTKGLVEDTTYAWHHGMHLPAPTQATLQKWLRDRHDIHCEVCVYANDNGKDYFKGDIIADKFVDDGGVNDIRFATYEECLEDCLIDALNEL